MTHTSLVSVIIPSYNRYESLLNAIRSVQKQTHQPLEIIVVNDGSTDFRYYRHPPNGVKMINLHPSSRQRVGHPAPGLVRNAALTVARGQYIAFLDDDDIWFPWKLQKQLTAMIETGCQMSCTDGLIGHGPYNQQKQYAKYNQEHAWETLTRIHREKNSPYQLFPQIWTRDFLQIHNTVICSSVVIQRDIVKQVGLFEPLQFGEDYQYWLRVLQLTNCVYVNDSCFYYDCDHGQSYYKCPTSRIGIHPSTPTPTTVHPRQFRTRNTTTRTTIFPTKARFPNQIPVSDSPTIGSVWTIQLPSTNCNCPKNKSMIGSKSTIR